MSELQIAVSSLMELLLDGGPEAASGLIKETAAAGAQSLANVCAEIFANRPQARSLADTVAHDPGDSAARQALREIMTEVLHDNPGLLRYSNSHYGLIGGPS
jgi:hypothetical protein